MQTTAAAIPIARRRSAVSAHAAAAGETVVCDVASASAALRSIRGEVHVLQREMSSAVDEYCRSGPQAAAPRCFGIASRATLGHGVSDREILQ